MKTLEEIKNEIAIEMGYSDWGQALRVDPEYCLNSIDDIAKRFAATNVDDVLKGILF